jgi:hypothetical protein
MAGMLESLSAINSFARTVLMMIIVGAGGWGLWYGYQSYHAGNATARGLKVELQNAQADLQAAQSEIAARGEEIDALRTSLAEKERRIARLDTALRLLKVDHRLAEIKVLEQTTDPASGEVASVIQFVEVNDEGHPIDEPRAFRLRGDMVYVDYWVVKFDDKYVERADLDRSTSICLFRRIFGEHQEPGDGYVLDKVGSRPTAYARGGKMSDFERQIWDDFWNIANDPQRARQLGIRAAHGEAVSVQLRPGKTYRLELRASGGLTIAPEN